MESSERFQHPDNLARQSSKGGPPEPKFSKLEISAAVTLTALALGFHLIRLFKAGALWRDEAAAVQLATMPHVSDMLKFFPHEAFPLLFSAMIRLWANAFGDSDSVWRIFGFLIGCSIIGALWRVALRVGRRVPLVSLALLAFNGAFLEWGDSVRAYGIGTLLILLTIGFLWRVIEKPGVGNVLASVFCAVASVHCLFPNAVFLFAVCTGATVVGIHRCWCGRMAESLL